MPVNFDGDNELKVEDETILTIEEIGSLNCACCGLHLEFTKNNTNDNYEVKCCDKIYVLNAIKYLVTMKKNPNVKVPKYEGENNHKIGHPDPVIKQRRYV